MTFVFYILGAVLLYFSVVSLRDGLSYNEYFRQQIRHSPNTDFTPYASIFVPCRGVDPGLHKNLRPLFEQQYSNYEIVFIVDDSADPAVVLINELRAEFPEIASKLIVAPVATNSSQKITNLREGVMHARRDSEVFVFVDSDARTSRIWLRSLVDPLADKTVGAATGYRWYIPARVNLGSELRSAWNASIATALGANSASNFCWGGSTAMLRSTFEDLNLRDKWVGKVSDDFVATRTLKAAGLSIRFVPQALTPTFEDSDFLQTVEFTTRQMKITRVYASDLWIKSLLGSFLYTTTMIWAVWLAIFGSPFLPRVVAAIIFLGVAILSAAKSLIRLNTVRLVLTDDLPRTAPRTIYHVLLTLFTPLLFLYNCVVSAFSRKIRWRESEYQLVSSSETIIISSRANKREML